MVQAQFRNTTVALQAPAFRVPRSSLAHGKPCFKILCYFQSGGNSGKRETDIHKGSKTGRAAGALLCHSSSPTEEANIKGIRGALGFSCHWRVRIILMKDRLFPPIPELLPSPFHMRLQFKERPNRGKGERGRAWVTDHAKDSRHLKADQKTKQGAPLTRELVSVARCNASVTSTRVGGSLEAWITWGKRKGLCYCKLAGSMSSVPGCS